MVGAGREFREKGKGDEYSQSVDIVNKSRGRSTTRTKPTANQKKPRSISARAPKNAREVSTNEEAARSEDAGEPESANKKPGLPMCQNKYTHQYSTDRNNDLPVQQK
ncbi:hypothetical protein MAR_033648 [Mya arenaria]|uniref:Uncharacterized protein n=1 Tax=Mya arenaria TaxID=6604 RepID=A0ABY7GIR4_MYAAR|nr:hypothetical protein MAR_033648 [Mya arenaria]